MDESDLTSIDHVDGAGAPPSLSSDALSATTGGDGDGASGGGRLSDGGGRGRVANENAPDEEGASHMAPFPSLVDAVTSDSDAPPVPPGYVAALYDDEDAQTEMTASSTVDGASINPDAPPAPDEFVAERIAAVYEDDAVQEKIGTDRLNNSSNINNRYEYEGGDDDDGDEEHAGTPSEVCQRVSTGSAPRPPQYVDEEVDNFKPYDTNEKRSGKPAGAGAGRRSPSARGTAMSSTTENAVAMDEDAHFPLELVKDEECPDGCPAVDPDRPPSPRLSDSFAGGLDGDRPAAGVPRDPSLPTFYAVEARLVGDSSTDSETEAQPIDATEPSRGTVYEATQVDETLSWWQKHQRVVLCSIGVAILIIGGAVVAIGVIVTRPPRAEPPALNLKSSQLNPTPPPVTGSPVTMSSTSSPTVPPQIEGPLPPPELFVEQTQAPVSNSPSLPPTSPPTSGAPSSPPTFSPPPIVLGVSNVTYLGKLFETDCPHTCGPYVALDQMSNGGHKGYTAVFNPLLIKPSKGEPAKDVPEDWKSQVHVWNLWDESTHSISPTIATDSTNATDSSGNALAASTVPEEVQRIDVESQPGTTAIFGDTMAVGSPWDSLLTGAVYLYGKNGTSGDWERRQKIVPNDSRVGAQFGNHVDMDGDLMVIGAYRDGDRNIGSVYIYREKGSQWVLEEKLEPADDGKILYFGMYVAIRGTRVAVSDRAYNRTVRDGPGRKGGFWVYDYDPSSESWIELNQVTTNNDCDDWFGASLAFTPDLGLLVGCPWEDDKAGAVFYYEVSDAGYVLRQKVVVSDGGKMLGDSNKIAVHGNAMLLGSQTSGAAYIFFLVNGVWVKAENIVGPRESKKFGNKIAMAGNRILVSSKHNAYIYGLVEGPPAVDCMSHTAGKKFFEGDNDITVLVALDGNTAVISKSKDRVQILSGADGEFSKPATFGNENSSPTNYGGVAISGDVAVAGTPRADRANGEVRVFQFHRSTGSWVEHTTPISPDVVVPGGQFGKAVDIDGGVIAVGAYDSQVIGSGSAYAFRRDTSISLWSAGHSGWVQEARLLPNDIKSRGFGTAVSIAGNSIVVGDSLYQDSRGAVFSYEYEPSFRSWRQSNHTITNADCNGRFGAALALTKDGGLLVGCPREGDHAGAVYYYVWEVSEGRYVMRQKITLSNGASNDKFGDSDQIAVDGNVMVVGTNREVGAVHVFVRTNGAWVEVEAIESPPESVRFGYKVALSGTKILVASISNVHSYTLDRC